MKRDERNLAGNWCAEGSMLDVVGARYLLPAETNGRPRYPMMTSAGFLARIRAKRQNVGAARGEKRQRKGPV